VSIDTLVWFVFILIMIEYNFRLRRSAGEKIEEKFEKLKEEFLKKQKEKESTEIKKE
jgi:hypothetical protein